MSFQVVVATPGRLWDLMRDGAQGHVTDLSHLSFLVLDEADKMVQQGHFQVSVFVLMCVSVFGKGLMLCQG